MVRRSDAEIAQRFRERYGVSGTDAQIRFEQLVLGSDFGANGWTTREQADELARRLELRSNDRLLDLGTGRGWPGLYLGLRTGCEVVLTDQPVDGLRHARQRAGREGVSGRCATVAASAVALPFRPESFDVVVHMDVLCCLRPKLSVLRATRRLLRPGGRTAFTTIHLPADLSPRQRRRAREAGPSAVETRNRDYVTLLTSVGFVDVDHIDVTAAYLWPNGGGCSTRPPWRTSWRRPSHPAASPNASRSS